jgi:pectinesterase
MISLSYFENSKEFTVSSYKELIALCTTLRVNNPKTPYTIYIKGKGNEIANIKFNFDYFRIISDDGYELDSTLYANMLDNEGNELTTWKTAALKVTGSHNIFINLQVANISKEPEVKGQEVAVGVYGDDNIFIRCHFVSTQDTLFVGPLPDDLCTRYIDFLPQDERYFDGNATNCFSECRIEGTVDFIFGAGRAIFDNCQLVTLNDVRGETYVVAPSHSLKDTFGYLFYQCSFLKEEGVMDHSIYLARPWRDYGKAVFAHCQYDSHISPLGFADWSNVNRVRTARFEEYPRCETRVYWTYNKLGSELPSFYTDAVLELRKNII